MTSDDKPETFGEPSDMEIVASMHKTFEDFESDAIADFLKASNVSVSGNCHLSSNTSQPNPP